MGHNASYMHQLQAMSTGKVLDRGLEILALSLLKGHAPR